ncbi:MAG: biotin-dependent carboxyltransferase family protein [Pseudomonadota bacterium]
MSRALLVRSAGPGVTVQDLGRPGYLAFGLSRGGAADRLAMAEGATLLGQSETLAAIEMGAMGGTFEATEDMRIAVTGAPMRAHIDGARLAWQASHVLPAGAQLTIGAATEGSYGYLHVGGGIESPARLGSRAAHLAAGLGDRLQTGDRLAVGPDPNRDTGLTLDAEPRFDGGLIRIVPSLQTEFFAEDQIARFEATEFRRVARGNRMGVPLRQNGAGFESRAGLSVLSEVIVPGDIQITGDGTPFVLLCECQTTGGYPRIGSVLPADLPRVAQAAAGARLRFQFVSMEAAVEVEAQERARRRARAQHLRPLIRDPRTMTDLLSFNLISGATAGEAHLEERV